MTVQLAPAPLGFSWVFNRLDVMYEQMFDGVTEQFKPHEYRLMTDSAAAFLAERSIVKEDPFNPANNLFAIARDGDENYGIPLASSELGIERLDRSAGDYVVRQREKGDPITTARVIPVPGAQRATKDVIEAAASPRDLLPKRPLPA